jgi:hypothetical protein
VPDVLIDGRSGLNILPEQTMKLGLSLTGPSPFIINMANQSPTLPLGQIKYCRISTGGEEYIVTFHVIGMHSHKDSFPVLLGRPWLTMTNAIVNWGGAKSSITYGLMDNYTKMPLCPMGRLTVPESTTSSDEEEDEHDEAPKTEKWVGVVRSGVGETKREGS